MMRWRMLCELGVIGIHFTAGRATFFSRLFRTLNVSLPQVPI